MDPIPNAPIAAEAVNVSVTAREGCHSFTDIYTSGLSARKGETTAPCYQA